MHPRANRRCTNCETCVKLCPVQAIFSEMPRKTKGDKCIACGRSIVVCPSFVPKPSVPKCAFRNGVVL
ncbi:4Fe-4S binding protein [Bacteroidales bacterium OttesenSCG-928-I14]|nr:4Fe-4S binding protein [Bacteroidales bacterium OttesenSCG-928-I14]